LARQAEAVLAQIKGVAEAEGTDLKALLKVTIFITTFEGVAQLREVLFREYGESLPASSLVQVAGLFSPEVNVEIKAVLAVPGTQPLHPTDVPKAGARPFGPPLGLNLSPGSDGMSISTEARTSKVPEVTLLFWVIKIAATTLGETGGDSVSMSMNLGYLMATGIFTVVFLLAVWAQIVAKSFRPFLYWATIVATTTVGTTLADLVDRSLGIGYAGGSSLLFGLLIASLAYWYYTMGSVSVDAVNSPKAEIFYWVTIMFSQTLGTALGDWTAGTAGLGYAGGAAVFSALLALVAAAYYWTKLSRTVLFWTAFILTRPLGAVVGDFLDKPVSGGGLALSRYLASAALLLFIVACLVIFRQRAATKRH
jgi:uncharacterized membrane-anchored protein